jgi:hypothetical protein
MTIAINIHDCVTHNFFFHARISIAKLLMDTFLYIYHLEIHKIICLHQSITRISRTRLCVHVQMNKCYKCLQVAFCRL